ncbi:putative flagellar associated protein [Blattamonas nauphoetae]|uniref:Dynein regulatory complex subunit 2 n=1 Tax=Blattamonas nauphoetae TaxID=2049346 RepID=A0ABQ9Y9U6_9EUKA|nr:putative flagellar associated protein [Blattamonas nauphoetae]
MPPKKNKGKKNKGGKKKKIVETDEEKRARLEADAMMQEELRRRKEEEELRKAIEKQKEEEAVARKNAAITLTEIRQRAREAKMKELIEEADVMTQTFERLIDEKDVIIESLFRDLEESERQYQTSLRSHLSNLDNLIDIQNDRLQVLEAEMIEDTEDITKLHEEERQKIIERHTSQKNELTQILQLMDERFEEQMKEDRKKFDDERRELEEQQRNELMANKTNLSMRVDILTTALQELHKKYIANTEKQTQEFRLYTKKEQIDAQEIAQLIRQIRRNQEQFHRVKKKIQQTVKDYTEKNEGLARERDSINKHYHELKAKMNLFRENEELRLRELTIQSREVMERLKARLALAERIIKTDELNRKLETEREKVIPFFPTLVETDPEIQMKLSQMDEEIEQHMAADGKKDGESGESETHQLLVGVSSLNQFFKRVNRVQLDKMAIEHEYARLQEENRMLQEIVTEYLQGVSINDQMGDLDNPVLIIRPSQMQVKESTRRQQAVPA